MPIVSKIGRKSFKTNVLFGGMYAFLIVGAVTMIYPFLLMLSGSTKSAVDIKYFDAIPRFLREDAWLYRKHIEALFNEQILDENMVYDEDTISFETLQMPGGSDERHADNLGSSFRARRGISAVIVNMADILRPSRRTQDDRKAKMPSATDSKLVDQWEAFLKTQSLPAYAWYAGHFYAPYSRTIPSGLRSFKTMLQEKYGKEITGVNREMGTEFAGWNAVVCRPNICLMRRNKPDITKYAAAVDEFKASLSLGWRYYYSVEGFYRKLFLKSLYTPDIANYNKEHGTEYKSWAEVRLPRSWVENKGGQAKKDWEDFVCNTLALQWIRADISALPAYRAYLQARHDKIENLNRHYSKQYKSFDEIPLIDEPPLSGLALSDWEGFINGWKDSDTGVMHRAPIESLRIYSVEYLFRDYLREKYKTIETVNRELRTCYNSFAHILPPQRELHYRWFAGHKRDLKWEFATRNYKTVADYMLFHGRGIVNTVIYCTLAVIIALLVNPLAAYALSRYKMPSTYKILLFLMATMAFPAMVTQIPNFLMLRQLQLLNTFAALILPGMANGYAIFLLKGFFDSLPRELYESAQLDGASEWTMFWSLTMSLSKPILAVIALGAFTGAYANFMFAFVVCQDEKMWTLMVWLYQLQQMSGQAVMYASLIIAAIPTFLIFLFCQNIIMRGIVVPSEK